MDHSKFSFKLTPTNPLAELGFEVWINDQQLVNIEHVSEIQTVHGILPDDSVENDHILKLVLKNKQATHTQIHNNGEIKRDACLEISELMFDSVELGFDILQTAVYRHNFNSNSEITEHKFFGTLGCNGTVELKFSTPIYIWLLEHM